MNAKYKYKFEVIDWIVSKRNSFVVFFVIAVVGFSSVLRANCPYRDDARTILLNHEEWEQSGRLFSHVLAKVLFFGMQADISPFIQIAALFVLSLTALLLLYYFKKDGNFFHLLCFLPVCLSPYILENLSYKFGSLWMAFSFLVLMVPFVVSKSTGNKAIIFIVTFLSVFLSFNIYQACFGFFLSVLAYRVLMELRNSNNARLGLGREVFLVFGALAAVAAYFVEIKYLIPVTSEWGRSHAALLGGDGNVLLVFMRNVTIYYKYLAADWGGSVFEYVLLVNIYVIVVLSIKHIVLRNNDIYGFVKCITFIFLLMFLSLAPFLIQLFLMNPVFMPRTFLVVGVSFAFILLDPFFIIEGKKFYGKIFYGIVLYVALQLVVISSIYGNLLASQMNWERNRMFPLVYQLLKVQEQTKCDSIYYENTVGYSPVFANIGKKYPVMYKLINPSVGSIYFASEVLREYGLQLNKTSMPPQGKNGKIYYNEPWYVVAANENVCVLVFK